MQTAHAEPKVPVEPKRPLGKKPQLISTEQINELIETVNNASEKAVETSKKAVQDGVNFAKEYPLYTALGAGVLGFVAGYASNLIASRD